MTMPERLWVNQYFQVFETPSLNQEYTRSDIVTALKAENERLREALASERNAIFYAMTRGSHYDIGLAKERMTKALADKGE